MKKTVFLFVLFFSFTIGLTAAKKSVTDFYNEGVQYQNEENWYLASQSYFEVVELNPAYSDAWVRLAECSYKLGEFDLALQYLEEAEKYEPKKINIQNLKGMVYLAAGETEKAKVIFNKILSDFPNDIDSHFGLAEIELLDGKFSGAENQYSEVLKRQNYNRKALLSIALVAAEMGYFDKADKYIRQAINYYSGDSEVMYLAAIISSMKGDYENAEKQCYLSVELNENNLKAYELLSTVMFIQKKYSDVNDLCDFLISRNRESETAWYLKGLALKETGNSEEAIDIWSTGLGIKPQDELMRSMMEYEIRNKLNMDDDRRSEWAQYHIDNGKLYSSKYDNKAAYYEYQRALLLDPMNIEARLSYANLLEMNGMHELYLNQLKFIRDNYAESIDKNNLVQINDRIEAYDSLLTKTIAKSWNVDPFYLDKTRWNIAVFYQEQTKSFVHADTDRLIALAAADIFSGVATTSVKTQVTPVSGFGEAFRKARMNGFDYFIIVSLNESQDDLTLNYQMYCGRTGTLTKKENFYSTGNNKFSTVLRRFRNDVLEQLSVRGKILKRNGKMLLVDLGRTDNIVKDAKFKIVRKGSIKTADSGTGIAVNESDVLGTLVITNCDEEVSEGEITDKGFYDKINVDDEIVLVSLPSENVDNVVDNVPAADARGNAVVENQVGPNIIDEIKKAVKKPAIFDLLRSIY